MRPETAYVAGALGAWEMDTAGLSAEPVIRPIGPAKTMAEDLTRSMHEHGVRGAACTPM